MRNPYQVLGIPPTASIEEVKSAYRRRAKETHPDLHGGSQEHAARFREVTDAYAVLSDPIQRRRYDESGFVDEEQVAASAQEILEVIAYVRSRAAEARAAASSYAFRGLAWLAGGAVLSLIGYAAALSSGGGGYFVFWGAILFGGFQALRGFVAYVRIGLQARRLEQNIWNLVTDLPPALPAH